MNSIVLFLLVTISSSIARPQQPNFSSGRGQQQQQNQQFRDDFGGRGGNQARPEFSGSAGNQFVNEFNSRPVTPGASDVGGKSGFENPNTTILKHEFEDDGAGTFRWAFETSDGFKAEQSGVPGKPRDGLTRAYEPTSNSTDEDAGGEEIQGSYSYKSPDGETIAVTYTAGVDGFRPVGAHIPTLPPSQLTKQSAPGATENRGIDQVQNFGQIPTQTGGRPTIDNFNAAQVNQFGNSQGRRF